MASLHKHIEGQTVDYIKIESENQKSGLIILLVLFHSACPYKNYYLKYFTELQTSIVNSLHVLEVHIIVGIYYIIAV